MIFAFEPNLCFAGQMKADFTYNGQLDEVGIATGMSQSVYVNVKDGIGLQSGNDWNNDPTLRIQVSEEIPGKTPTKFYLDTNIAARKIMALGTPPTSVLV